MKRAAQLESGTEERFRFVWDKERGRPYCVLIQALYGGDRRGAMLFDGEWTIDHSGKAIWMTATESEMREYNAAQRQNEKRS